MLKHLLLYATAVLLFLFAACKDEKEDVIPPLKNSFTYLIDGQAPDPNASQEVVVEEYGQTLIIGMENEDVRIGIELNCFEGPGEYSLERPAGRFGPDHKFGLQVFSPSKYFANNYYFGGGKVVVSNHAAGGPIAATFEAVLINIDDKTDTLRLLEGGMQSDYIYTDPADQGRRLTHLQFSAAANGLDFCGGVVNVATTQTQFIVTGSDVGSGLNIGFSFLKIWTPDTYVFVNEPPFSAVQLPHPLEPGLVQTQYIPTYATLTIEINDPVAKRLKGQFRFDAPGLTVENGFFDVFYQ